MGVKHSKLKIRECSNVKNSHSFMPYHIEYIHLYAQSFVLKLFLCIQCSHMCNAALYIVMAYLARFNSNNVY